MTIMSEISATDHSTTPDGREVVREPDLSRSAGRYTYTETGEAQQQMTKRQDDYSNDSNPHGCCAVLEMLQ